MKIEKLKEINNLFFEFFPLYQQKLAIGFYLDDSIEPKCTKNQLRTLFIIREKGKILPTDLGKYLDMQKGSLTTLIDSLEEVDFVQRVRDPHDRRKTWIFLKQKGEDYINLKIQALELHFQSLFKDIPAEEIEQFAGGLKFMVDMIKKL